MTANQLIDEQNALLKRQNSGKPRCPTSTTPELLVLALLKLLPPHTVYSIRFRGVTS